MSSQQPIGAAGGNVMTMADKWFLFPAAFMLKRTEVFPAGAL
jgi:hypothetical protein